MHIKLILSGYLPHTNTFGNKSFGSPPKPCEA